MVKIIQEDGCITVINSQGEKYYLHQYGKLSYFKNNKVSNALAKQLPSGYVIKENPRTHLPILKRK